MNNKEITILIADDHEIIRQGLKSIIGFEKDLHIIGEADDGEKVITMLKQYKPQVILLDLNMPKLHGIEVLKQAKKINDSVKIILLTVENKREIIHKAINAGADGYILKESAGVEIVDAIKTVCNGEKYIDKSLVSILFSEIKSNEIEIKSILDVLSKREIQVLLKISKGFSNKEIGQQLYISEKTVKNYATNLFRKLNASDRVHAAIIAIKSNLEDYYVKKYGKDE